MFELCTIISSICERNYTYALRIGQGWSCIKMTFLISQCAFAIKYGRRTHVNVSTVAISPLPQSLVVKQHSSHAYHSPWGTCVRFMGYTFGYSQLDSGVVKTVKWQGRLLNGPFSGISLMPFPPRRLIPVTDPNIYDG